MCNKFKQGQGQYLKIVTLKKANNAIAWVMLHMTGLTGIIQFSYN